MRITLIFIFSTLFLLSNAQNKSIISIQKSNNDFFQGNKLFCSDYRKTKYRLFIKGNEISITSIYNGESTIKGIIKNGKIYSSDAFEKSNKIFAGKVYIIRNNTLRILTSESGEYDDYFECKK